MRTMVYALCLLATPMAHAGEANLTVHVDQPGVIISPLLYGIFLEEINRAADGGIYAEMIQNRSFEDAAVPIGWSVVKGDGKMALDNSRPLNANNPTSLRLDGRVSIANEGFKGEPYRPPDEPTTWYPRFVRRARQMTDGIAVRQDKEYQLSLYACGQGPVTVTIEKQDGSVLAKHEVTGIGAEWKKFDAVLTPGATETDARLVIANTQPRTVWVDMVSLMPKGQLFREDLLKLLADMKPGFMRFPGGCLVEGDEMRYAYRWKKTIGDIARRPGFWNRWGHFATGGLGFHEYLLLCEAIGAEPLFDINCGMAHKDRIPLDQMDEFVQDALDAVEYCNGPADSKWGALRTKAGHPAPFNLKYMEIGNENKGGPYAERYALIRKALLKCYPDLHLIVNYKPDRTSPAEIADEHLYRTPEFFMLNADIYDKYDRKGHKVLVGEYAGRQSNLRAALGEAVFMIGMERNSDVVVMASYAPLLERVGWKCWHPNAIRFDAARSYGTPSWQVQTMFGRNRADVVLPVILTAPTIQAATASGGKGRPARDSKDTLVKALFAVAGLKQDTGEIILKVVNVGGEALDTAIDLSGARISAGEATAILLTSNDPADENSFDEPNRVSPEERAIRIVGSTFQHTFPAYSVTILRLTQSHKP